MGPVTRVCAVAAVFAASVLLAGCTSVVSGTATRPPNAAPLDVAPLTESKLDDVLVSIDDINEIMGASSMKVVDEIDEMTDHSDEISDPDCLAAIYAAQEPVYAGSDPKAVRDQVAREPKDDQDHWVEQAAVLFDSADDAQKLFDDVKKTWENCAGSAITTDSGDSTFIWQVEDVKTEDSLITQVTPQEDAGGWTCQHALSVVSNVAAEVWACSFDVKDEAGKIATTMIENATKK